MTILSANNINRVEWSKLVASSATGTWFQSVEAYAFFASMPELFKPFVIGLENDGVLRAVCVGYITVEKNPLKQFLTRRAIIIGGPCLADDCINEEVIALLEAVKTKTRNLQSSDDNLPSIEQQSARKQASGQTIAQSCAAGAESQQDSSQKHASLTKNSKNIFKRYAPIYIESRNFNDYSRWKSAFEKAGFAYQPHLNFHVHSNLGWAAVEENIGKHRKKYIRLSFRDGASIEENPTMEQVHAYYEILKELYKTKVRMPLQPWEFFEKLYQCPSCKYLLVMFDGQVVGGSICMLLSGHGVYEWYACGKDGVFKNIHPSSVTKYAGMKYACDNGYAVFDMMGAGKPDEEYGVRDFKAEFGGELVEHGRFLCVTKPLLYRIGVLGVKLLKRLK